MPSIRLYMVADMIRNRIAAVTWPVSISTSFILSNVIRRLTSAMRNATSAPAAPASAAVTTPL